jgi:O-antigen ligase
MSLQGIDDAPSRPALGGLAATSPWRGAVFVATFLLVWVSTAPFKGSYEVSVEASSNIVNQISFTLMALLGIACVASAGGRVAYAYLRPAWLLLLLWMTLGVVNSANPEISMRAFRFTLVVLAIAGTVVLLPRSQRDFAQLIGIAALIVLLICYAGLVVFRDVAVHSGGDVLEPEHAGAWRGLFDHKNIAGAMMVILMLVGIFVATAGSRGLGIVVTVLAATFLFFTGSKTSMGLGPFVVLVGLACARIRSLWLRALLALGPLAILLTATLGSVLFPQIDAIVQSVSPDQTFTGRTEIWRFAIDRLWNRPIFGYGFEGFWQSDYVLYAEPKENESGISNGMVHGHNGYVDLAIGMGIPGLILGMLVLVLLPLRDHHRVVRTPENKVLAELFFRIWLFAIYSACLESFFFRRADPVWFALLVSVIGLRLTSKYRVAP